MLRPRAADFNFDYASDKHRLTAAAIFAG